MTEADDHHNNSPVKSVIEDLVSNDYDQCDTSSSTASKCSDTASTSNGSDVKSLWTGIQNYIQNSYGIDATKRELRLDSKHGSRHGSNHGSTHGSSTVPKLGLSKQHSHRTMTDSMLASVRQPKISDTNDLNVDEFFETLDKPFEGDIFERRKILEERLAQLKFIRAHYRARNDQFSLSNKYLHNKRHELMERIGNAEEKKEAKQFRLQEERDQLILNEKDMQRRRVEVDHEISKVGEQRKQTEESRELFSEVEAKHKEMVSTRMDINVSLKKAREHTLELARQRVQTRLKYENVIEQHQIYRDLLDKKSKLQNELDTLSNEVMDFEQEHLRLSKQNLDLKHKILDKKDSSKHQKQNLLQKLFSKREVDLSSQVSNKKQTTPVA